MPLISRFFGISIYMYVGDHNPPHFHAEYGEFVGQFCIKPITFIKGKLPSRVTEWASQHQDELMTNWEALQNIQPSSKIDPLT